MMKQLLVAVLMFVSAHGAIAQERVNKMVTRFYDTRDIVLHSDTPGGSGKDRGAARTAGLISLIKSNLSLHPETALTVFAHGFHATGPQSDYEKIEAFMSDLRRFQNRTFKVDVKLLAVPVGTRPPDALGVDDPGEAHSLSYLTAKETAALTAGATVVTAPAMNVQSLRRALVSVTNTRRFVTGHEVMAKVEGYADGVVVPTIETVQEGVQVSAYVIPANSGNWVTADLELKLMGLERPPQARSTEHGLVHDIETSVRKVKTCVTLSPGATVAIFGLQGGSAFPIEPGHEMAVLITVAPPASR